MRRRGTGISLEEPSSRPDHICLNLPETFFRAPNRLCFTALKKLGQIYSKTNDYLRLTHPVLVDLLDNQQRTVLLLAANQLAARSNLGEVLQIVPSKARVVARVAGRHEQQLGEHRLDQLPESCVHYQMPQLASSPCRLMYQLP